VGETIRLYIYKIDLSSWLAKNMNKMCQYFFIFKYLNFNWNFILYFYYANLKSWVQIPVLPKQLNPQIYLPILSIHLFMRHNSIPIMQHTYSTIFQEHFVLKAFMFPWPVKQVEEEDSISTEHFSPSFQTKFFSKGRKL
jgi:hypothetical protein